MCIIKQTFQSHYTFIPLISDYALTIARHRLAMNSTSLNTCEESFTIIHHIYVLTHPLSDEAHDHGRANAIPTFFQARGRPPEANCVGIDCSLCSSTITCGVFGWTESRFFRDKITCIQHFGRSFEPRSFQKLYVRKFQVTC